MDERDLLAENFDAERDAVWTAFTQAATTLEFREADDASKTSHGLHDAVDDVLAA